MTVPKDVLYGATTTKNPTDQQNQQPSGGYPSGGGGSGSGSSGPTKDDKETFANLGALTGFNMDTLENSWDMGEKVNDINNQFLERQRDKMLDVSARKANNDWYSQVQNLQSVGSQLIDAAGNALNGSFLPDVWDLFARRFDQDGVAVLNTLRDNWNEQWSNFDEAFQAGINNLNDLAADVTTDMRDVFADYFAQGNNIHHDLTDSMANTAKHSLKPPDWIKERFGFFDDHVKKAHTPTTVGLFRPANSAVDANKSKAIDKDAQAYSSSTNSDWWSRRRQGYERRTQ